MILRLTGFLMMIALVPPLFATADALRWAILAIGLSLYYATEAGRRDIQINLPTLAGIIFLGWSLATIIWSVDKRGAPDAVACLAIMALAYWAGFVSPSNTPVYRGMLYGLAINSCLAIAQHFGWDGVSQIYIPAGLFLNKNMLAEIGLLLLAIALMKRWWYLAFFASPSVMLTSSKAVLIAGFAMFCNWMWHSGRVFQSFLLGLSGFMICWVMSSLISQSLTVRVELWQNTIHGITLLGQGLGSFWYEYPNQSFQGSTLRWRAEHAHNEYLEVAFELGTIGLLLGIAFIASVWHYAVRQERIILLGAAIIAGVAFPLHNPATAFLICYVAGCAASNCGAVGIVDALRRIDVSSRSAHA